MVGYGFEEVRTLLQENLLMLKLNERYILYDDFDFDGQLYYHVG